MNIFFPNSTPFWLIDYREPELIEYIENFLIEMLRRGEIPLFDIQDVELAIADVQISDDIAIEIKRVRKAYSYDQEHPPNDLYESWKDGRLYEQTEQRHLAFNCSGIIIQKEEDADLFNITFTQEKWFKTCIRLQRMYNQLIWETSTIDGTFKLLLALFMDSLDTKDHHNPTNKAKKPESIHDQQIFFISSMKGFGKKQTEDALELYKAPIYIIKEILTSDISYTKTGNIKGTTCKISGVGPKTVIDIKNMLITEWIK